MDDSTFFATTAQVIPLMFVAIFFEGRSVWKAEQWAGFAISRPQMAVIRAIHMFVITIAIVIGEATALWALGHEVEVSFGVGSAGWLVAASILLSGALLFAQVVAQILLEYRDGRLPDERHRNAARLIFALITTVVGIGGAVVALQIASDLSN